jgi:hypothetical protein
MSRASRMVENLYGRSKQVGMGFSVYPANQDMQHSWGGQGQSRSEIPMSVQNPT